VKFLLIDFRNTPTIGYVRYSPETDLEFDERKEFLNINNIIRDFKEEVCIVVDEYSGDEPFLTVAIKKLLDSDYKITTKDVTNAIKRIDNSGKINSHLDREKYERLATPIKAEVKCIEKYFNTNLSWDFEKYLRLNNVQYKDYQRVEAGLILESK